MFKVFDPNGITRPYAPSNISHSRTISSIQAVSAITPKLGINPQHGHSNSNPYQKLDEEPAPKRILYAKDLMSSPVITLDQKETIEAAQKLFAERHFKHAPILNSSLRIIGIVSDRDVLRNIADSGKDIEKDPISSIMKTEVLSTLPDTDIHTIARVMFEEHIGSLPIIDQQFSLVGIITRSDILRALLAHGPVELWG